MNPPEAPSIEGKSAHTEKDMDKIYDELDKVKAEAVKLRDDCRAKTELSDNLRKAHVEQLAKIQHSKLEMDKLALELNVKSVEIYEIRQMYEELQSSMGKKDLFLQQIISANEKLRAEYGEKILKLEGENRDLVVALDEASARIQDLEKTTCASSDEIAGLKRLLSMEPEKSLEAHKNASKDMKKRDEYILKLEEEIRITQDQLKWKNEQFSHLEEAHTKLQTQFQASKVEWQEEKSSVLDEVSSLQSTLDAQVRVSESLETQLRMTNQALAHEESRRKVLEVQLSESRSQFDNVFQECQLAKSEIEEITMKRDEEIAEQRMQLRKKETLANEMKYKTTQLEKENNELLMSLEAMQEGQLTNYAKSSALTKLQKELHDLEQLHNKCAIELKEKEAEWNSQVEKLTGDMNCCSSELDSKNKSIGEIHKELEDCQYLLELKNEENLSLVMVLKSEFYGASSKLYDAKEKLEKGITQLEEKNMLLNQRLQSKDTELREIHDELKHRCDEIAVLMKQVQSIDSLKQKDNIMEEEIRRCKAMLEESKECQHRLEQQILELENIHREKFKNAFEMVNFELANRTSEIEKSRIELQNLNSEVEILKSNLEKNQRAHEQEKANLLVIVKDKDAKIAEFQEQISELDEVILAKSEAAELLNLQKDNYNRLAEDRNCSIESLQDDIAHLKNELAEREARNFALLDTHNTLKEENLRLLSNMETKDQKIQELQKELESLAQNFKGAMISLAEKEVMLEEALRTAEGEKFSVIEERNRTIANLEKEIDSLRQEVEFQGESLIQSKQMAVQLEASLQTNKSEMLELKNQLEKERSCFGGRLDELESHKQALLEDLRKASTDREDLLVQLEGICGQIGVFCREDAELRGVLGKILHSFKGDSELERSLLSSDGTDATFSRSPSRKVILDERNPLTQLNC